MNFWKRSQTMGIAAIIVGLSVLLSRFMGLIRDKAISYWFGASLESDLYFAAFVIPDFINYLLAGAYFSITLIPILGQLFQRNEDEGWNFFSTALLWIFFAISLLTLCGEVFTEEIVPYIAPGISLEALEKLTSFVRIILPAQVFFLTGSCFSAILYLRRQFIVPSLSPIIYNGGIILVGLALKGRGIEGFCWGVLVGSFIGNFLLPLLAVQYGGGMALKFRLWHSEMKRFITTALPLMVGQSIVVLDEQLVRIFGSLAGTGAVSHINYARRLMMVPVGIVGQAAAVASYPFMSELFSSRRMEEFFNTIKSAIKHSMFLIIFISCAIAAASEPIVGLIFQQGRFEPSDTLETAKLLRIYLIAAPLWAFQQILGRGFYATGDTLSPVIVGSVVTFVMLPIFWLGAINLGSVGVVGASVIGFLIYSVAMSLWWIKRLDGKQAFKGLFRSISFYVLGGVFSVFSTDLLHWKLLSKLFTYNEHSLESYLWFGLMSGTLFFIVWLGFASLLFRKDMVEITKRLIKKKNL
ncbi:MAG: murein biosynthesis integral membrane protein MurJ [Syntrophobacterales bacterium]|nr:murein biosynthesis integral membrane protein MurJ [Syntrophobacterales bacterium]